MKKMSLAILLLLVFCSVAFAAIKDSPDGFRGVKWGYPPSALGARTKIGEVPFGTMYIKTGDKLSIGTTDLEYIVYIFFQDRELAAVRILAVEGISNARLLSNAMVARYGEPVREEGGKQTWIDEKVYMTCEYDKEHEQGVIGMVSQKIFDKIDAAKKREAEKAAKDF